MSGIDDQGTMPEHVQPQRADDDTMDEQVTGSPRDHAGTESQEDAEGQEDDENREDGESPEDGEGPDQPEERFRS